MNGSNYDSSDNYTTVNSGKKATTLHIAHRRSPSDLTNLMVEQYNLQRQLEIVQAQQQQILQQQQQFQYQQQPSPQQFSQPAPSMSNQQPQFTYPPVNPNLTMLPPPPPGINTHNRTLSSNHQRNSSSSSTGFPNSPIQNPPPGMQSPLSPSVRNSSLGHNRRHSLGINEAKKAAAMVQSQRNSNQSSGLQSPVKNFDNDSLSSPLSDSSTSSGEKQGPPSFKFPNDPVPADSGSLSRKSSHGRSRSLAYGQQTFQFPATNPNTSPGLNTQAAEGLLPPMTSFSNQSPQHQRSASSHLRTNSRNFDPNGQQNMNMNWRSQQPNLHQRTGSSLEPPVFIPGHRSRGSFGGSSTSSLSNFMPPTNNNNNGGPARKSLFAPYLPQSSLPELIGDGRLVTGILRVNKKNRSDAYVSTDGLLDADIFISGSKDRNRALEGDLVAIELLIVDEVWGSKKEKEEKKRRKDQNTSHKPSNSIINDDMHNDASTSSTNFDSGSVGTDNNNPQLQRKGSLKQRPTMKKNDDLEVEGQSLLLVEEEEINDEVKPLYAGHVVAVVDRIPGQLFSGSLLLFRPSQAAQQAKDGNNTNNNQSNNNYNNNNRAPKIVWFKPTDKKVPLIAIPTEQAPKDFVDNHDKYANQLFVASIKRWPITSLHPFGTLVSKLGKVDDPETEIDSILRDNNFLCDEYPTDEAELNKTNFLSELPKLEDGLAGRKEFFNEYIISFTQNEEFTDHALHVKRLNDTKIELGVHIADVTYFIEPGSFLDRKAKKRSSSVFLPQKATHLLPTKVNELISFKENEKNVSISVVFEIDTNNFEVDDVWIGKSSIIPKQKVSYDSIDLILTGGHVPQSVVSSATCDYIRTLSLISREFKRQRLSNKKLSNSPNLDLLDSIDDEKVRLDLNLFKENISLNVLSEIFHKVNSAVGQKIHSRLGEVAMLRRQGLPTLQKMENFVKRAKHLGYHIDTTTSATLQNSILSIEDPVKRQCVESLLYKCMNRGKYFIAGKTDPENYSHYYLNLPIYCHFNAPLRRYADFIVHRQLKSIIDNEPFYEDIESLKMTADYCNFKKDCAKSAQEQAIHLLLSQTINEMSEKSGQLLCMGTVVQVYESAFDVFIPEFGIEKRVHGDQLPLVKAEFDKNKRILELYWEKGVDSATYVPPDEQSTLSYRNSIKNKFRAPALEAANVQNKTLLEKNNIVTDSIIKKLGELNLSPPKLQLPTLDPISVSVEDTRSLPTSPISANPPPLNNRAVSASKILTDSNDGKNNALVNKLNAGLKPYLKSVITRLENDYFIQEVREFEQVPILLRAEIGMALPCLTVRALNPFSDLD